MKEGGVGRQCINRRVAFYTGISDLQKTFSSEAKKTVVTTALLLRIRHLVKFQFPSPINDLIILFACFAFHAVELVEIFLNLYLPPCVIAKLQSTWEVVRNVLSWECFDYQSDCEELTRCREIASLIVDDHGVEAIKFY